MSAKKVPCVSCDGLADRASRSGKCKACFYPPKAPRLCDCGNKLGRDNSSGRCRACFVAHFLTDPEIAERRLSGTIASNKDPALARRRVAKILALSKTPEGRAARRERARAIVHRTILSPEAVAKAHTPEAEKARGLARTERLLGWCPAEYRDHYRCLLRRHFRKAEAKARTLAKIAADRAAMSPFERQMAALRNGARLVERFVPPPREYAFTLGGVSEAL